MRKTPAYTTSQRTYMRENSVLFVHICMIGVFAILLCFLMRVENSYVHIHTLQDGTSCLYWASRNGFEEVVRYLVEQGGMDLMLSKRRRVGPHCVCTIMCQNKKAARYSAEQGHASLTLKSRSSLCLSPMCIGVVQCRIGVS
jgi:hypothetical protein